MEIGGMMQNIMVDLEAFDSRRTAAIVSIGAVYFDIHSQKLGEEFYVEISKKGILNQLDSGRTMSLDTLYWWLEQSDEARDVFKSNKNVKQDIVSALHQFSAFCQKAEGRPRIWGNGVDYDNVVLRDTYETYHIGAPWTYSDNRCYRTIKNLFGARAKLKREGAHHNGLADAITQAKHLMAMLKGRGFLSSPRDLEDL
jgi:hypothetical protein